MNLSFARLVCDQPRNQLVPMSKRGRLTPPTVVRGNSFMCMTPLFVRVMLWRAPVRFIGYADPIFRSARSTLGLNGRYTAIGHHRQAMTLRLELAQGLGQAGDQVG